MLERHLSITLVLSLCLIPAAGFLAIGRLSCANFHSRSIRTPLEVHVEKSSQPQEAKHNKRNKRRQRNKKLTHAEKLSNRLYLGGLDLVVDEKALMVMCKERGVDPFAVEFHAPADGKKGYAWLTFPDVPTAAGAIVLLDGMLETVEFSRSVVLEEGDLKTWESSRSVDPFRASARIGAVLESLSAGSDSEKKTKEGDSQIVTNLEEALKELLAAERVAEKTRTELDGLLETRAFVASLEEALNELGAAERVAEETLTELDDLLETRALWAEKTELDDKFEDSPSEMLDFQAVSEITKTGLSNSRKGTKTKKKAPAEDSPKRSTYKSKGPTTEESPTSKTNGAIVPIMVPIVPEIDLEIDLWSGTNREFITRKLLGNELKMRNEHVALDRFGRPKESFIVLKTRLQAACGGNPVIRKMTNYDDEIPESAEIIDDDFDHGNRT